MIKNLDLLFLCSIFVKEFMKTDVKDIKINKKIRFY